MSAVATRSVQGQAVAALTAEAAFDDDEPQDDWFPKEFPDRAAMRPYKVPVQYWEPEEPGKALMPFSRMGHVSSTEDGRWVVNTKWEEDAVRQRLSRLGDPDDFKIDEAALRIIQGKAVGEKLYCHSPFCHLVTTNATVARLHETARGHTIKFEPRKAR
jgi:hypothetical protein